MIVTYFVAVNQPSFGSVILDSKAIRMSIQIDAETAVVGGIGGWVGLRYVIVPDAGVWLF